MKETGTTHWASPNTGATNSSGFTALPGSNRLSTGGFNNNLTFGGYFWSSTETSSSKVWYRSVSFNDARSTRDSVNKASGYSVRCLSDCLLPNSPATGTHVSSQTQIIWNWTSVSGATGYKWNTTNNYATATDMGTATTKTETGLTCNTAYTRYVWAYNACGPSTVQSLASYTTACPAFVCGQVMTDARDSKTYNTVLIGTQCLMKQNLNFGTMIYLTIEQTNISNFD